MGGDSCKRKKTEAWLDEIRKCSLTGRPCGDEAFTEMLERRFGRRLKPLPQGKPRKGK